MHFITNSDFCRSGDYKGLDFDCRIEVAKVPSQCYAEHFELKCCASCFAVKEPCQSIGIIYKIIWPDNKTNLIIHLIKQIQRALMVTEFHLFVHR